MIRLGPPLRRALLLCALLWLSPATLGAAPAVGSNAAPAVATKLSTPRIFDLEMPDLDRRLPGVLDLSRASLMPSKPPGAFATEDAYKAELRRVGDLAFDDANGGMLFVASGRATLLGRVAPAPEEIAKIVAKLSAHSQLHRNNVPGLCRYVCEKG